jgi:hypothetical protein
VDNPGCLGALLSVEAIALRSIDEHDGQMATLTSGGNLRLGHGDESASGFANGPKAAFTMSSEFLLGTCS